MTFFELQLDYIYFFYGLAFLLLGVVSFSLRKEFPANKAFLYLGLFGFIHGLNEWLDLLAINQIKSDTLVIIRTFLLLISFIMLFEFGRQLHIFNKKKPLPFWAYFILLLLVFIGIKSGIIGISITIRYFLGFPASLYVFFVLINLAKKEEKLKIIYTIFAFVALVYAVTNGIIVPKGNILFSDKLNYTTFIDAFGFPVQFVHAFCATSAAILLWFYFITKKIEQAKNPGILKTYYRLGNVIVAAVILIIILGWFICNLVGSYSKAIIVQEANNEVRFLISNTKDKFFSCDELVKIMSGSNWAIEALDNSTAQNLEKANIGLDRYATSSDISIGYLLDKTGLVLASSNRNDKDSFVGHDFGSKSYFQKSMQGSLGQAIVLGTTSQQRGYFASSPVKDPKSPDNILGVVAIKKFLDEETTGFNKYPLVFLVNTRGIVFLSSVPGYLYHQLFSISKNETEELVASRGSGSDIVSPIFGSNIKDGEIVEFKKAYYYLCRRPFSEEGWEILFLQSYNRVFEYRLFAILIVMGICLVAFILGIMILNREVYVGSLADSNIQFQAEIIERKKAVKELYIEKNYSEKLFSISPSAIFVVDKNNRITLWNEKATKITGYSKEEMIGKECFMLVDKVCRDTCLITHKDFLQNVLNKQCSLAKKDGSYCTVLLNSGVIRNEFGEIVGAIESFEDITQLKDYEEKLKKANLVLHDILAKAPFGIYIINHKGFPDYVNSAMLNISGNSFDQFMKLNFFEIPTYKEIGLDKKIIDVFIGKPFFAKSVEYTSYSSGKKTVRNMTGIPIEETGEIKALIFVEDITELYRAEEAKSRLAAIVDSTEDAVIGKNLDGLITSWNKGAEKTYGYTVDEMVGKPINLLVPPEIQNDTYEILNKIKKGESVMRFETIRMRKDGKRIFVALTVSPIFDESGNIIGSSTIARDISERKKLDQLKDEFISTVSHELRTPLSITKEGISLILEGIPGVINPSQQKILKSSKDNIDRLSRIINELLDISRIEAGKVEIKRESVNFIDLVNKTLSLFAQAAQDKNLKLTSDLPEGGIDVYVDADKMLQVLTNLVDNATKFTKEGSIEISAKKVQDGLECCIKDTGVGISEEDLPKVFSKFEQFGRVPGAGEKGTGLGLSIAKGIVDLHKGRIWVESEANKGTAFKFVIPIYTFESLAGEFIVNGIRRALENDSRFSVVSVRIIEVDKFIATFSQEKIRQIGKDIEIILKNGLRHSGDTVLKDTDELLVFLNDCYKENALRVEGRFEQTIDDYLVSHNLVNKIHFKFSSATFPEDASNASGLYKKARRV